jgi:hypothetical protein
MNLDIIKHGLKQQMVKLSEYRKQAKMQLLQDTSRININELNSVKTQQQKKVTGSKPY